MAGNVSLAVGLRRLFYLVTPNETSFEKLSDVPDYVNEAVPFFNGAILLEFVLAWFMGFEKLRVNDAFSSTGAGVLLQVIKMLCLPLGVLGQSWVYTNFRLIELPWDSPFTWWIGFLTMDLLYYWFHRAAHEVNFMWAAHQAHHSSEDYNLTTALRQSVVQHFYSTIVYTTLGLVIPPSVFLVHVQFNLIYQFWIHTELVKSLGPLEYILNAPSHHRVHHGRNPYCIDKNYGGTLIIWDRLFGTFQDETDEKVVYGLVHPLNSWNPIWIQICHFVHIAKTAYNMEGYQNKLSVLVKGPGWSPGKPRLGDSNDIPAIEYPVKKFDVSLPLWGNIYSLVHAALISVTFQSLSPVYLTLTQTTVYCVVFFIMFTITSFGLLMEKRWFAPYLELLRCVLFLLFDHYSTTPNFDLSFLPWSILQATRIIYVISASIWFLVILHGEERSMKED